MPASSSHRHMSASPASSEGNSNCSNSNSTHRHNNHHHHFQSHLSVANSQARLEQLFDEQDHKRCSEGNRKALLAENLDQLRGLAKVLEADDWKYHSNNNSNNSNTPFPWSSRLPSSSAGGSGPNHA
uniref:Uncharacterized protein n=1 Tax=Pseudo-nitzschia australis TaxID=44445 RepID=A0A7S4EHS7_9STRA|mmetsp:Transcript_25220/g.55293  ORF Transcript_25220/g.55293 Transcript_25220/m.55293 type:complete len:127 (+) Transcript_25220:104-484(+)|eukprot:CAMPEP_0168185994 /NCGR_PEP_ID=MMETSP0139_2-20121125/14168_1 /TAXON_ID=44445 /ORGANISM="Pseudo-nitzschia australis, Strain 10249 10 AB" /LENGTH=126 /DNA_ID=CAMNT_0008107917 /DNA_START=44 /DNA_END=424 /DNA_ORIENTATION=+